MNFIESLKMALDSIKANKMRSFLTMLGIIIGISSVITIISLGEGSQSSITVEFEKMGANNVTITVDKGNAGSGDYITLKDIEAIETKVETVKSISPSMQMSGIATSENVYKTANITGTNEDYKQINNYNMVYGRFFNKNEVLNGKPVAVIDENTAIALLGNSNAVGKSIKVGTESSSKKVTIVGVRESAQMGPRNSDTVNVNIPITYLKNLFNEADKISSLTLTTITKEDATAAGNSAINILKSRHHNRGREIYQAESMLDKLSQINDVLDMLTTFIAAVAAISLLVGGIGVMNIMLVSVTERTREIGIRKAIGATTKNILIQFLTESSIIALIGGIIGMAFGFITAQVIGMIMGITPTISIIVVIGVMLFSSSIGIFFGIYPAKKAAKLNPIDALRYE